MQVQSVSWEDPLEEGMATHSSILSWKIPMNREAWQATAHRVAKRWIGLKQFSMQAQQLFTQFLHCTYNYLHSVYIDFPGGSDGKVFIYNARRPGFEPWVGKIPWRRKWQSTPVLRSDQIRSVAQSCPTLCDPMNRSTPGLAVHHQLLEFTQTHVHQVSDAIQPSYPLSSPSPPAPNPSQHQSLFQ